MLYKEMKGGMILDIKPNIENIRKLVQNNSVSESPVDYHVIVGYLLDIITSLNLKLESLEERSSNDYIIK